MLAQIQQIACSRGGELLSTEYINNRSKLSFRCGKLHEFEMDADHLKNRKQWCKICSNKSNGRSKRLDISVYQQLARDRGGVLLSTEYINKEHKLKWKCSEGHVWEAVAGSVKNGKKWCRKCADDHLKVSKLKYSIQDAIDYATENNGECLNTSMTNCMDMITWRCNKGHEWTVRFTSAIRGFWCRGCCSSKSENVCREILQNITGWDFPNTRPEFLQGLELDGYNKTARVAFEYNGEQHYKYIPHFHRDPEDFNKQLERDRRKYRLCAENKVDLIIIPYTFSFNNKDELEVFIRDELEKLGH